MLPTDGYPAFPSSALTLQLLGIEESHYGAVDAGRKEIINLCFPVAEWDPSTFGPVPGQYSIPFSVKLPDWLPDSMMLAEPIGNIMLQVKYRLTAQLESIAAQGWVAELPDLHISKVRHERALFVNRNPHIQP